MFRRRTLAMASATVALLIAPAGALAVGTTVTVRVEGAKHTLLAPTVVHTHAGSILKGGAPKGSCPATAAVGALQLATKGHWGGTYVSGLGIELISIFNERYPFSSSPNGQYWGFWIDNQYANAGICGQALHKGDTLLFAPAPNTGNVFPTAIRAPRTGSTSSPLRLRVVFYNKAGKARPLAKARVSDGHTTGFTNAAGYVTLHIAKAGKYRFTATEKGYIRPVPATVKVS